MRDSATIKDAGSQARLSLFPVFNGALEEVESQNVLAIQVLLDRILFSSLRLVLRLMNLLANPTKTIY